MEDLSREEKDAIGAKIIKAFEIVNARNKGLKEIGSYDYVHGKDKELNLRVVLTGNIREYFLKIKEDIGIKNNTEALRYIINDYYKLRRKNYRENKRK